MPFYDFANAIECEKIVEDEFFKIADEINSIECSECVKQMKQVILKCARD